MSSIITYKIPIVESSKMWWGAIRNSLKYVWVLKKRTKNTLSYKLIQYMFLIFAFM